MSLPVKTNILNGARLLFRNRLGEAMLLPLTKGKRWDDLVARIPANYYQYPQGSFREVERNGFRLTLDLSDYMQWLLYFGILAEPRETLYDLVAGEMTVIDAGANIGETSLEFSRRVGETGKVIAFEPDPQTFARLKKHLDVNRCTNVIAINEGVGKTEGESLLKEGKNNSGGNRIAVNGSGGKKIRLTTIDRTVEKLQLQNVDFIKIDVEGFEMQVLGGAEKTLERFHPALFIEVNDELLRQQNASAAELTAFLTAKKYSMKHAGTGQAVTPGTDFRGQHFDIIATPV